MATDRAQKADGDEEHNVEKDGARRLEDHFDGRFHVLSPKPKSSRTQFEGAGKPPRCVCGVISPVSVL